MVLAELEVRHSRPVAPTRRVALGERHLPVDDPPGSGGILLAAVVGRYSAWMDDEEREDLRDLLVEVERGLRIVQPRLRHRFQADIVGLGRTRHRLVRLDGDRLRLRTEGEDARPAQHVLAAVYAAAEMPRGPRKVVIETMRRAMRWGGVGSDVDLLEFIVASRGMSGATLAAIGDPRTWAMTVLGFDDLTVAERKGSVDRESVQAQFRRLLRDAHPDQGGTSEGAAERIAELSEARRILLA